MYWVFIYRVLLYYLKSLFCTSQFIRRLNILDRVPLVISDTMNIQVDIEKLECYLHLVL